MFLKTRKKLVFLFVFALCAAGFLALSASSAAYANTEDLFSYYQAVPTSRSTDWESFTIDGDTYLAVANTKDNSGNVEIDSKIYKWNGVSFAEFQTIPTIFAHDWESFTIDGETYLAVGYHRNNAYQYNLNSKIYKWNGALFEEFQAIPTSNAQDWESFTIGSSTYLAVANGYNGSTYNIDSKIYKWNGASFVEFQTIPTSGAQDWKAFMVNGETYLAVANYYNGYSKIYKWNGALFEEFQNITTYSAREWESFTIDGSAYLAIAQGGQVDPSKIYKWNGTLFDEIQSISTSKAVDWKAFTINGDTYLAVANNNDLTGYNINSIIYKWNGVLFEEHQVIPTNGAADWESFTINDATYLVLANNPAQEVDSIIYKANINNNPVGLDNGLVGHWKFNEGSGRIAFDSIGSLNGSFIANPEWVSGIDGSAVYFDAEYGERVQINIPGGSQFNDFGKPNVSYSAGAWFKTDYSDYLGQRMRIIGKDDGYYRHPFQLSIIPSGNNGIGQLSLSCNHCTTGGVIIIYTNETINLSDGRWHHLIGVRDQVAQKVYLYLDGILAGEADDFNLDISNSDDPTIGNGGNSYVQYPFNGIIDDARIYDRALSPTEIKTLYEQFIYCGNGNIDPGEECDDGNTSNGDGCDENCAIEPEEKLDPVILIPGAMGSWRTPDGWALDPITHTYVDIENALKWAGYEPLKNLFVMPYEWRNSNVFTATLLKEKIDEIKEVCGCDKIDIVAHSMGGLVAREYIQGEDYEDDVDQLIFLGTPHKGATMAYLAWEGGSFGDGLMARLQERIFKQEAKHYGYKNIYSYIHGSNIVSVKEFLPVYDYLIDMRKKGGLRIYPDGYPINSFLDNLNDFNSPGNLDDVNIVNILGRDGEKSTLNNIIVRKKKFKDGRWEHGYPLCLGKIKCRLGFDFGSGDGTVPERSNIDFYNSENVFIENASHRAMVSKAQARVIKELTGEEPTEVFSWGQEALRLLIIRMFSPADFTIINPLGEKLGRNFASSTTDNEIEMAFYSGFSDGPEFATIPNPIYGEYTLRVIGTDEGVYTVSVGHLDDDKEVDRYITRAISEGEIHEYTFVYSEDGDLSAILPIGAAGFDKLIGDTKDLYSGGEIKKRWVKTSLVAWFKHLKKKYESIGGEIKGCGYKKWSEKKDEITKKYIKFRLNMIKKQLRFYLRRGWITEEARNLLVNDINAIIGTLK